eukprot:6103883-Pyramimonas_sp.AAC.1
MYRGGGDVGLLRGPSPSYRFLSGVARGTLGPRCPQLCAPFWSPLGPPGGRGGLPGNPGGTLGQGHF